MKANISSTVRGYEFSHSLAVVFSMMALLFLADAGYSQQISSNRAPVEPLLLESGTWTEAKFLVADVDYVFRPLPNSIRVKTWEVVASRDTLVCVADRHLIAGSWRWVYGILFTGFVMITAALGSILLLLCLAFSLVVTVRIVRGIHTRTFWHDCMDRMSNPPIVYIFYLGMPLFIALMVFVFGFLENTKLGSYAFSDLQNWASDENVAQLWIDNSLDSMVRCEDINNPQHAVDVPASTIMKLTVSCGTLEMVISNDQHVLEEPTLAIHPNTQKSRFVYSVGRPDQFRVESKLYE